MRRVATLIATTALGVVLVGLTPSAVSACTSDHPTFTEAVRGARAIARVTVVEGFDTYLDDPTHSETYRVERLLKGSLPEMVTVAPAWTSLCHDSVGYYAGPDGAVVIVAIDVPYYDQVIHPMWAFDASQGVSGSAGVPSGVFTLLDLEAAIHVELGMPDTATPESTGDPASPLLASIVVAALAGIAVAVWTTSRARGPDRGTE